MSPQQDNREQVIDNILNHCDNLEAKAKALRNEITRYCEGNSTWAQLIKGTTRIMLR